MLEASVWLEGVVAHPEVVVLRTDGRASLLRVAEVLAAAAGAGGQAAPTWPVLVRATGLSRRSVARKLAWLDDHGLLQVVENGHSDRGAPVPRPRGTRQRGVVVTAAVYRLTLPPGRGGAPAAPALARSK